MTRNSGMPSLLDNHGNDAAPAAPTGPSKSGAALKKASQHLKLGIAIVCFVAAAVIAVMTLTGGPDPAGASKKRTLIDSETKEVFEDFRISDSGSFPYTNPKTGKQTLYPAERCHWTKDGKAKLKPTYVLLNQYAGGDGETKCPDCGRTVRAHNPMPPMELMDQAAKASGKGE